MVCYQILMFFLVVWQPCSFVYRGDWRTLVALIAVFHCWDLGSLKSLMRPSSMERGLVSDPGALLGRNLSLGSFARPPGPNITRGEASNGVLCINFFFII